MVDTGWSVLFFSFEKGQEGTWFWFRHTSQEKTGGK